MVFDEIDAGIGGQTAHAVGETLRRLAGRAQVLTITHLPQIASLADRHFRVEKVPGDPTHTRSSRSSADERRDELERMLGGAEFLATLARMARVASAVARAARARARTSGASLPSRTTSRDWWPGIVGVEPDRRGFAERCALAGVSNRASSRRSPASSGACRRRGRARAGRSPRRSLIDSDRIPYELLDAGELVGRQRGWRARSGRSHVEVRARRHRAATARCVTVTVASPVALRWTTSDGGQLSEPSKPALRPRPDCCDAVIPARADRRPRTVLPAS